MTQHLTKPTGGKMHGWTRRTWLATTTQLSALMLVGPRAFAAQGHHSSTDAGAVNARRAAQAAVLDPGPVQALAQRAVDAARSAGASYADARLTRTVWHQFNFGAAGVGEQLTQEYELVGCGVRVLVNGCWGFASATIWLSDAQANEHVVQLARDAVGQAKMTAAAKLTRIPVELRPTPAVTGTWRTPCKIDPFSVSIEEKYDTMGYWELCGKKIDMEIDTPISHLNFVRQERVVANSDGSLFTQTCYETGGYVTAGGSVFTGGGPRITGITMAGQGWERLLDANIPAQLADLKRQRHESTSPATIGRYTLVCDGSTMAAVVGETLGIATQLDRALGYEANTGGTSFLNDPLAMLGSFQVAPTMVTVTANRSAPTQLATVQWDDEGVAPRETTLIKDGVLTDFQTTREQASWLAPYYTKVGRPVVSNGYAGAQEGQYLPMQMRPNLALAPSPTSAKLDDLIASVKNGVLIEGGVMRQVDFQARNGVLFGAMRQITNGKLGRPLSDGSTGVLLNTPQFFKQLKAVGDASTTGSYASSIFETYNYGTPDHGDKGNPPQRTSYTAQGVAALIEDQAIINLSRKA